MTPRERNMDIIDTIAFWHGVGVRDIINHDRRRHVARARRDCARYFRSRGDSFLKIGRTLQRDHTTIVNLVYGKNRGGAE